MSASTIAAARLRHQVDRTDQHQRLPGALGLLEEARVRSALLAFDSGQLSLPEAATFEPLLPTGTDMPILDPAAVEIFASHTTFEMPRFGSDAVDVAHRFCLRDGGARLNQGLKKYALHLERYARRSGAEPEHLISGVHMLPHPRDRSASGVHISNRGGFQSYPDLFDYFDLLDSVQASGQAGRLARGQEKTPPPVANFVLNEWGRAAFGQDDLDGRRFCQELHRVAFAAIDDLQRARGGGAGPPEANAGQPGPVAIVSHRANAWLNVNRADDVNLMHVHQQGRLSATYYVAGKTSEHSLDGRLVFRTGARKRHKGEASPASHAYMSVPPVPGTLWLFPGSVPHRVFGMSGASGQHDCTRGMWAPRISVALNFLDAECPA